LGAAGAPPQLRVVDGAKGVGHQRTGRRSCKLEEDEEGRSMSLSPGGWEEEEGGGVAHSPYRVTDHAIGYPFEKEFRVKSPFYNCVHIKYRQINFYQ
jgi:hypothetical protein